MFYWIALLVAYCLAGCRSHLGETDMQTRMRTEIVTNVRDSVLPFWMDYAVAPDGGFYGTVLRNGTPVVANVGVLTTGFDYPELDTVVMARPTMSLAMWYQIVGRAIRPHPSKECGWIVDLCGNIKRFGEVSDLRLFDSGNGKWAVFSNGRQLTNVRF